MTLLRFREELRYAYSHDRYQGEADIIILPIIPRVRPDWREQNLNRCDGIAKLIKTRHPTVSVLHQVEPPCDVAFDDDVIVDGARL